MIRKLRVSMLLLFLISSLFITTAFINQPTNVSQNRILDDTINNVINDFFPSEGVQRNIRIAIYNEPSKALPSYATDGVITNNFENIQSLLEHEGYSVDILQYIDIQNHELVTVNYDVFILVDSLPRDEIAYLVKDFWLGGGAILSFNTAIGFLCYFGMLTGTEGDFGYVGLDSDLDVWMYNTFDDGVINARHPAAKDYHIGDTVTQALESRVIFDNGAFGLGDRIGQDYINLARDADDISDGIAFAVDNHRRGGKIIHLPGNCSLIPAWIESVTPDAIDWLSPRPKARILFDLSHSPFFGIDEWDPPSQPYYYSMWRDGLVNRSYTVDKLHPSSEGNLTLTNLAPYDMLVISLPNLNFTSQETLDIQTWIDRGGALQIFAEGPGGPGDQYLVRANQILEPTGIVYNRSIVYYDGIAVKVGDHLVLEECNSLSYFFGSLLNLSGNTEPLWEDGSGNYLVAAAEYGAGRVIASGDVSALLNGWIDTVDNFQFVMNMANWLTSSEAEVLLYTTEPDASNYYRTPVANALNDLGISFYLTGESPYMNLSLNQYSWTLAILDGPRGGMSAYYDEIREFVIDGGKLIMSDYQIDDNPSHPLWATLGFEFNADAGNQDLIHIYETSSNIFHVPNNYRASNFTPNLDYSDEGDRLEPLSNGIALAYVTNDYQAGTAVIILRDDEQTLYNGYLIDQLQGDIDDSTYMDAFELWENEIVYMLPPELGQPLDAIYVEGETENRVTWYARSLVPWSYIVSRDTDDLYTRYWNGDAIVVNIDGLTKGEYQYYVEITDRVGRSKSTAITVTVLEAPDPITSFTFSDTNTTSTNGTDLPESFTTFLIIIAGAAAVMIVVVLVVRKKKGS